MTGFGAASLEEGGCSVRVEVRSVNHRFLQVKSRLPAELSGLDGEVEAGVRKKAKRGAFTVTVQLARAKEASFAAINAQAARQYARALEQLAGDLGLAGGVRLEDLLQLPGVVESNRDDVERAGETKRVLRALAQALEALIAMRRKEGEALAADLAKHVTALRKLVARIGRRMPVVVQRHHANLRRRVDELLAGRNAVSEADLAREVAVIADRLDIAEELSRLESHLDQLGSLLERGGALGRQLDFLVQELLREVNTVGSKCNDAQVAHWVVEAKTRVERMREQVQNVE